MTTWVTGAEAMRLADLTRWRFHLLVAAGVIRHDLIAGRTVYDGDDVAWVAAVPVADRTTGPRTLVVRMVAPPWTDEVPLGPAKIGQATVSGSVPALAGWPGLYRRVAGWEWGMGAVEEERACTGWWPEPLSDPVPAGTPLVACCGGLVVAHWVIARTVDAYSSAIVLSSGRAWQERRVRYEVVVPSAEEVAHYGCARVVDALSAEDARWIKTGQGGLTERIGR